MLNDRLEKTHVHLVDDRIVSKLENLIEGCEHCDDGAEYPFDWIMDKMMRSWCAQSGHTD